VAFLRSVRAAPVLSGVLRAGRSLYFVPDAAHVAVRLRT